MKNKGFFIFIFMFIFLIGFVHGKNTVFTKPENLNYIPGEIIVKYKDQDIFSKGRNFRTMDFSEDWAKDDNLEVKETFNNLGNIALVEIKDDKSIEETIELLENNPNIEYAEPNYIRYFFSYNNSVATNDPRKGDQRSLEYIDRPEAYNLYSGVLEESSVPVAVIDNGVNYNHPDLSDSMRTPINGNCKFGNTEEFCVHGYDFLHGLPTPLPNLSSHGTHVAGIIAATINNGKGIIGINPHAKIAALKVGNSDTLTTSAEIRAINFAIENNIKIINASYGAYNSGHSEQEALERYKDFGGLFITAAGNDKKKDIDNNPDYTTYPCMYDLDNIICVASIDKYGNLSSFSNFGKKSVDIAAPGTSILSTSIEDSSSGTEIYSNNFNDTSDSSWTNGNYFYRGEGNYAYGFTGNTTSPSMNLSGKRDVFLDFFLACASYGTDVELLYSTGNKFINEIIIPGVYNMGYYYTIPIIGNYYTENFSLKFETDPNTYCIIDNLSIYEDPYYMEDKDRYTYMDGTSMATPHVAGLASLVWSINPELTYSGVKNLIIENGSNLDSLNDKIVSGKVINVKRTLDAAAKRNISPVTGLQSSWTGDIKWNETTGITKYYIEVFSGDDVIKSGIIENETSSGLDITGNYTWIIQGLDKLGNKSEFSTGYICSKPTLSEENLVGTFSGYECSTVVGNINYNDACSDSYEIIWSVGTGTVTLSGAGTFTKNVLIRNGFGEETDQLTVYYTGLDSLPTANNTSYTYESTITSTSSINISNLISIFGVQDGACGTNKISINSVDCNKGQRTLNGNNLQLSVPSNQQGNGNCTITFRDDELNQITGNLNYTFNTIQTQSNNGGGSGGGGGGGSGGGGTATKDTKATTETKTTTGINNLTGKIENLTNTGIVENNTEKNEDLDFEKERTLKLFEDYTSNYNNFDFSRYNNANPSSIQPNGYTVEFNNAYEFAHRAGITTINSIEKANMNGNLTRIAMAKMLSNYAINILGKVPANSIVPYFPDVSQKMNDDYGGAVTLSYQLGIMGKGINKFRPNDIVSRAEFGTALSRMLYGTQDGKGNYYSTHLNKLNKEGIISNTNPNLKELRGYVMIMLMRSAKN